MAMSMGKFVLYAHIIYWLFMLGVQRTFDCADVTIISVTPEQTIYRKGNYTGPLFPPGQKPPVPCLNVAVVLFHVTCFTLIPLAIWFEVTYGESEFIAMVDAVWAVVARLLIAFFEHYFISAIGLSIFSYFFSLHVEYTYNSRTIF